MAGRQVKRKSRFGGMTYRIKGIFCGCLIFAEFCGSIEIAEIKNRKIFQSRYKTKRRKSSGRKAKRKKYIVLASDHNKSERRNISSWWVDITKR